MATDPQSMTSHARYAIYYLPPENADWARFCTAWLGWDAVTGRPVAHPDLPGLPHPVAEITARPRRYGLHATIKPPFRLAPGRNLAGLRAACAALARDLARDLADERADERADQRAPLRCEGLALARLGRFLALRPEGELSALNRMAARVVAALDDFRAPPGAAELARRRQARLSPAQEANLKRWGYPYVMDEFHFHITLTGPLPEPEHAPVEAALHRALAGKLPAPFEIPDLALMGEDAEGRFHLIHRYRLSS